VLTPDTAEELDAEPLYRDFLRPNGIGWATGTHIALPTGDVLSFNMERRFDRGPVERHFVAALDAVRPHLARAAMVGARLQLTKADTAVKTLSMLGMPAAVLGSRGQMLAVNQLLESLVPTLVQDRQDRLHLADVTADQILGQTLSHVREKRGPGVQSFPVSDDAGSPVAIAHVLPVTGDARDLFARSSTVLVIMPVDAGRAPSAGLLRALFDLTTGEARVALALADGRTIGEAAQELGISRETARTHLRSIFAKTGVSRQSGLMRKMSGVTLPGLREAEVRDDDRDIL
jgi:DNA-binding CsgD family transcriptional regulator